MPVKLANQVVAQPVSWLWPDTLSLGNIAILDGDPDLGKSLLALDLCARLSTGRPFADGRLDDALAQTDARFAVIDPIMAFLDDSVLCASDQSVRRALSPLMQQADKHRCAVLMLRHLNKQGGSQSAYRGLGSIAFVAACRSAMLVARDPLAPGRCVLAQVRNSHARLQPSLGYQITADGKLPSLEWLGPSSLSANQLLAGAARTAYGPREQAAAFLEQFLGAGPRSAPELWAAARKAGLAARTLQRARKALDIRCRRLCVAGKTHCYWLLPGQQITTGDPGIDEINRRLAEMERLYPPSTPLEEDELDDDRDLDGDRD